MIRSLGAALCAALLLAPAAWAQAPGGSLMLYTSQPQRQADDTIAAFAKAQPGVKVEFFRSGTTEVINKLRTELAAGAPQPDLLLIADAVTMEALKAEGRLARYDAAPVTGLPAGSYDPDRTYFGTKLLTTGIVYNTAAPLKPASWKDLLKAEARNQVVLPSPLFSGAAAIFAGALAGAPEFGWPYFEGLAKNGATALRGNPAVLQQVAGGQKMYGIIVDFMAINEKRKGAPVEFVFPAEGVTVVTEPVAILTTARNPAAAKAFIDFLLSKDGQALAATQGALPVLDGIEPPAGFPAVSSIKLFPADAGRIRTEDEANKRRFADLFGN